MKDGMRPVFLLPNDTWSRLITERVYQWPFREGSTCDERHMAMIGVDSFSRSTMRPQGGTVPAEQIACALVIKPSLMATH